jgi:hypothetical protein
LNIYTTHKGQLRGARAHTHKGLEVEMSVQDSTRSLSLISFSYKSSTLILNWTDFSMSAQIKEKKSQRYTGSSRIFTKGNEIDSLVMNTYD